MAKRKKYGPPQGTCSSGTTARILREAGVETEEQLDALCLMAGHDYHKLSAIMRVCPRCRTSFIRSYSVHPTGVELHDWKVFQYRSAPDTLEVEEEDHG